MTGYEYKVVPAPEKGQRGKGVRGPKDRFANALETLMNDLACEGWEYQRTDTLPSEERQGLTGKVTLYLNMLVFRRPRLAEQAAAQQPPALPAPGPQDRKRGADAANVTPLFVTDTEEDDWATDLDLNPAVAARAAQIQFRTSDEA